MMRHISVRGRRLLLWSVLLLCGLALTACGYRLRAAGRPLQVRITSLAIPMMESSASIPGFEGDFTRMVRQEFISHARIPLVSKDDASAVLVGKVVEIRTRPYTYHLDKRNLPAGSGTWETTSARWLKIRLDVRVVDRATGAVIWRDRHMKEKAVYEVGTDPLVNRHNQEEAVREIAGILAERIYLKTMERF